MAKDQRTYYLASSVCSEKELENITNDYKISQSIQKHYRVFCEGFVHNDLRIKVYSKRPVTNRKIKYLPAKNEETEGIQYHYSSLVNLPVIGNLYALLSSFMWFINRKNCGRNDFVFLDPLNVSVCLGSSLACKIRNIKTIQFITDVPQYYVLNKNGRMSLHMKVSSFIEGLADGYIFITEEMNTVVNNKNKPYCVIEGFASEAMINKSIKIEDKYKKKVCMYTGGLRDVYGLDMLIEGFLKANVPNSELHIYGYGDYEDTIKEYARKNENIIYGGSVPNSRIIEEQMKATLLVNPRYTDQDYTKYSFPGKNMEYATSGTPILTTALPGMPKEYYEHVFILYDETIEGMAQMLSELLAKSNEELFEFGRATKKWVIENKSSRKQISKVIYHFDNAFSERK